MIALFDTNAASYWLGGHDNFQLRLAQIVACSRKTEAARMPEAVQEDGSLSVERVAIVSDELDEIAELRRLSAALAEPESRSYTIS